MNLDVNSVLESHARELGQILQRALIAEARAEAAEAELQKLTSTDDTTPAEEIA